MFKNPFSFNGRIRRLEYALSNIIYCAAVFVLVVFLMSFGESGGPMTNIFMVVLWVPIGWFMLAQGAKRCHDRGNSGVWQIIPFYGIWMWFAPGDIGVNEYGPNPKGLNYDYDGGVKDDNASSPIDDVDEDGIIKE